ncbi:MAG: hypothetical protein FWE61_02760 [Micrococcales bacterium]|nr:hypothetical protein [Micrococcales bacterium]
MTAVALAVVLGGCTSSGGTDGSTAGTDPAPHDPGGVLVEQTIDTVTAESRKDRPLGGTMTVTVRSVTVSQGRTVVTWAMRWDNPGAAADASAPVDDFFRTASPPVLTDGTALKYYYPLCRRDWRGAVNEIYCRSDALFSPRQYSGQTLVNHETQEAWAIFPEVGKDTTTVDLSLPGGLPTFHELPVTRQ